MANLKVVSILKKGGVTIVRTAASQTFLAVFRFSKKLSTGDSTIIYVPVILDGHESPACAYFECVQVRSPLVVRDPSTGKAIVAPAGSYVETPVDDAIVDKVDDLLQDNVLNDIFATFDWKSKMCHYTSMPWYKNGDRLQNVFRLVGIENAAPGIADYFPMPKAELIKFAESLGFDCSALKISIGKVFSRDYSEAASTEEGAALVADLKAKWGWKYATVADLSPFQKKLADAIIHNEKCNFFNIYGPSGNGKTSDVEIVCSVLGIPMLNLTGDPGVTVDDLMGCLTMETDGQGHTHTVWNKEAPLYKARVKGYLVNIAEIMQYNQPAKAQFNSMFDGTTTFLAENGKVLAKQSPNFVVVGSFNPGAASNELFDDSTKSRATYFFKPKLECKEFADIVGSNNERSCGRKLSFDFYRKLYSWIDYCMNQRNLCSASADINTRDAIIFTSLILTRPFEREEFGEALYSATLYKLGDASEESSKQTVELANHPDVVKKVDDLYKLYDFKVVVEAEGAPDFDDFVVAGQATSGVIGVSASQSMADYSYNKSSNSISEFADIMDSDLFGGAETDSPEPVAEIAEGNGNNQ